jgi:CheY-like chemotaxis protein/glycine cleavage system H lipoate-binding protein
MNKNRILVVDDEINVCKSIRQSILREDCEVDMALSGEEALKKDDQKAYDLVITDLMMPGISGLDLLRELKARRPEVNIIMVTGYPTIRTAVESIKLGAFDYLPKPFTPAQLRNLVHRALKKKQQEQEQPLRRKPREIPPGLFYMIGHTWLKVESETKGRVGIMADFFQSIGRPVGLDLPEVGQVINQGEPCATLVDDLNFSYRIWSPASGRVIGVNMSLKENLDVLFEDPYEAGWLFTLELSSLEEDIEGLVRSK